MLASLVALLIAHGAGAQVLLGSSTAADRAHAAQALAAMNAIRASAGLAPLAQESRLAEAAAGHAAYLAASGRVAHDQPDRAARYFTGATVAERVASAGGKFIAHTELASRGTGGAVGSAVDLVVSGIYHRLQLLRADLDVAGVALRGQGERRTLVAKLGALEQLARAGIAISWPPDGATVPAAFDTDAETPDPLPERNKTGYPISVQIDPREVLTVEHFELIDARAQRVAATLHTAATDRHTPAWAAFLLPSAPLARDTRYRVRFAGTSSAGERFAREWTFHTAPLGLAIDADPARARFAVSGLDATETYVVCHGDRELLQGLRFESHAAFSFERRGRCSNEACEVRVWIAHDLGCRDALVRVALRLPAPPR